MKYFVTYQNHKVVLFSRDFQWFHSYGASFLDEDTLMVVEKDTPKAMLFSYVWKYDFFLEHHLFLKRKNKYTVEHFMYADHKWHFVGNCEDYQKINDTKAIFQMDHFDYLYDVLHSRSLSILCDQMKIVSVDGKIYLLVFHDLIESSEVGSKGIYFLKYYIDLDGNVVSQRLNTFTHEWLEFPEEEIYFQLEQMRKDCQSCLAMENECLKRSISLKN